MGKANLIEAIEYGEVYTLSDLVEILDISKISIMKSIVGLEKEGIIVERHKEYGKQCEYKFQCKADTIPHNNED